jgi:predicted enzyme related to lactoylglutathione lyase
MSSPIKRQVGQVFIPVRDMQAAASWYAELLGLEHETGRLSHEDTIFDIPTETGPRLCLDANRPDFVASGPARFFFWTSDMEATVRHLGEIAADEISEVHDIGSLCFVTFKDPDGNLLMVAEPN